MLGSSFERHVQRIIRDLSFPLKKSIFFAIQEDGRCIKVGEEATPMLLCEQFRIDHAISTFLFSWTISCPTQANIWMIDSAVTNVVTCGCCFGGANSKVFNISLSRIFEPPIWGYPVQAHVRAQIAEKCTEDSFCSKPHDMTSHCCMQLCMDFKRFKHNSHSLRQCV